MYLQSVGFRRALAAACILLLGGAFSLDAQSAPPRWFTEMASEYPDAKYLAAAGSGSSRRGAEDDAAGGLARLFSVKVKVDAVAQQKYAEFVKGDKAYSESEMAVSQTVGTQASGQFVNMRFSDPYTDQNGTVHVAAFLEREPTAAIYRSLIQKDLAKVDDFSGRAASASGSLKRYAFYDAAYNVGLNAERLLSQLHIIHVNTARPFEALLDLTKIAASRDREASRLTCAIDITGDEDKRLMGIVKKALESVFLSYKADGRLSVKGSWSVEPVTVNPQFKSVEWMANISLYNEAGAAIATFSKRARQNAATENQAAAFAYREAEKALNKELVDGLNNYLKLVVTGQ
ncbi:MAG: hypothetical protein LBC67_02880 [Spirochaetales bacterium]|jgi:hypothetical protein|nr:hypothetical protein [Spirochaetales bacterium]